MKFGIRLAAMFLGLGLTGLVLAQEPGKADPEKIFKAADGNGDGKLSLDEYTTFLSKNPALKDKQDFIKQSFQRLDTNKDGFLSLEEFRKAPFLNRGGFAKKGNAKEENKPSESAKATKMSDNPATPEQIAFFEKKIRPVLVAECYSCHSADAPKLKGGLSLDTHDGLRRGGDTGPAIAPGDPARSLLIKAIGYKDESMKMPPKKKLADSVVADFETWVKMGAPDPREGSAKIIKNEINIEKGRDFWAFKAPKQAEPPKVADASWARTDVDRFLMAAMETKGLKPVADAEPYALLRRLYLDLTGLPPTPDVVEAFLESYAKNPSIALEAVVDRLLATPQYGERWGRHWLDVARYAESTGKAVNFAYTEAWRYRDYVIRAYNEDKPYDLFVKEQLAGDLMKAKDDKDKADKILATGFLALGTKNLNERSRLQFELDVVDEQIDTFSQAFLGMTAACARCHDHKFDPIPTKDYYALAGIFRSTETCYGTINSIQARYATPLIPLPASLGLPAGLPNLSAREREQIEKQIANFREEIKKSDALSSIRARAQIAILEGKLAMYEKDGTPKIVAMGVREKARPFNSPVYNRGEPDKPGEVVPRGVLQVVDQKMPTIKSGSGRLELADWIVSKDNPLTARVYVNRVWLHLFGRGIVATPDNFGTTGQAPSNLALLDYLALQFEKEGWSTKKLIKQLVLSHVYQLSAKFDAANAEADPDNALCWRMTPGRLDAEVLRDSLLLVGGRLDLAPPKENTTAKNGEGNVAGRRPGGMFATDSNETHRSVYLPIIRDNLPDSLSLFDAADPNLVTGERMNTTVPSQALFLMNNSFVIRQSEAAAERILASGSTDSDRIRQAYLLFFARLPNDKELSNAEAFINSYSKTKSKKSTWSALSQAMFGSAEFLMRN